MRPVPLSQLIARLAASPQIARNQRMVALQKQWPQIVGEAVARHSRPLRLQEGVLVVAVSGAAWAQNLAYQRRLLLERIGEHWQGGEKLSDIRFETTGWYQREQTARRRSAAGQIAPARLNLPPVPEGTPAQTLPVRLARLKELTRWRREQLPGCPRCHQAAFAHELERWGLCGSCAIEAQR